MSYKKWIKIFFIPFLLGSITVGGINYIIDPFWTFSTTNKYNNKQFEYDERQQKTNFIYFNNLDKFEGILLGSSRTTYINQNDFTNMHIYNYAFNSMYPHEYQNYINFAKEIKGKEFKYIIIGADFFGTNIKNRDRFETPSFYINNTKEFFYRYKLLLSLENLNNSIENFKNSSKFIERYYDRKNIKYRDKISEEDKKLRYKMTLNIHINTFKNKNYAYDNEYKNILKSLKQTNPDTKFIIFTSPITSNLLVSILRDEDRLDEYKRWLSEMIEVFDEVHHYMSINHITKNLNNYADDDHYYPYIGKIVASKITTRDYSTDDNFGFILNKYNFSKYIKILETQLKLYQKVEK